MVTSLDGGTQPSLFPRDFNDFRKSLLLSQHFPRVQKRRFGNFLGSSTDSVCFLLFKFLFVCVVDCMSWFGYHFWYSVHPILGLGIIVAGKQIYKIEVTRATTQKRLCFIRFFMFSQCSSYDPLVGKILFPLVAEIPMTGGKSMIRCDHFGFCDSNDYDSQLKKT